MVDFAKDYTVDVERRFLYFTVAIIVLCFLLFGRLYQLQILKGEYYRFFASENSIKQGTIVAPRGEIFDRKGKLLVSNTPAFDIVIIPQYIKDPEVLFNSLNKLLGIDVEYLNELWRDKDKNPSYMPIVIKRDVSLSEVSLIRSRQGPFNLIGVDVVIRYMRKFSNPESVSHLIGYVKEIDEQKLRDMQGRFPGEYFRRDMIGIKGIEGDWEQYLRGKNGFEQYVVNAVGQRVDYKGIADSLLSRDAKEGAAIHTTIDADLQDLARELFKEEVGAAVMMDVNTGAIRVLYSSPPYNIEKLTGPDSSRYWETISSDKSKPLLNRAVQSAYPPASTFKIVTALSSLEREAVKKGENINCFGALTLGNRAFHCWNKSGHGPIGLFDAIVQSCDVFFYSAGLRLGPDSISEDAIKLGLGKKVSVGISGERKGLMPSISWRETNFKREWQGGDTVALSIGQGYNLVTPIQNALMLAHVVNGGYKIKPHLVENVVTSDGIEKYRWKDLPKESLGFKSENIKIVKDALVGVVKEPTGTAHFLSQKKYSMGGKTGTAQVVSLESTCTSKQCRDHGWFVGFAPADDPRVAVAVIVEHSGFGAGMAAPIAGALLEKYLEIDDENGIFKKTAHK